MTITDLLTTSYATEGHIQRAFYATYMQVNCLRDISLNPQDYGKRISCPKEMPS